MPPLPSSLRSRPPCLPALLSVLALAATGGCTAFSGSRTSVVGQETFDSAAVFSRGFEVSNVQTCEAARRALLSQGYALSAASADLVQGRKNFQPKGGMHVEVDIRVVCVRQGDDGRGTIAFASGQQDWYALKKSSTSASVGVGVLGSLSLPLTSSDESLVKVASETIAQPRFYDRFFAVLERYLQPDPPSGPAEPEPEPESEPEAPAGPAMPRVRIP